MALECGVLQPLDIDALSDSEDVFVAGVMQHIEEAGIHSGDSACSLPPVSIKPHLIKEIESQTKKLALKTKTYLDFFLLIVKETLQKLMKKKQTTQCQTNFLLHMANGGRAATHLGT